MNININQSINIVDSKKWKEEWGDQEREGLLVLRGCEALGGCRRQKTEECGSSSGGQLVAVAQQAKVNGWMNG